MCTLYVYVMSGFAKNLNIQNCENSTGNLVHYICMKWPDLKKNWISRAAKIQRKILYVIYVQNVWFSKKVESPKLSKLIRKLHTLYVWNVWIWEKSYIQNGVNSQQIVYVIYAWNVRICWEIEYPELRKFNGKMCTLYM